MLRFPASWAWLAIPLAGLVGCGTSPDESSEIVSFTIPMVPETELPLTGAAELVDDGSGVRVVMSLEVPLILGEGYPRTLTIDARAPWTSCGRGTATLASLTGSSDAISARLVESTGIELEVHELGESDVVVVGEYVHGEASLCGELPSGALPFEVRLHLRALPVTGARWARPLACDATSSLRIAPSSIVPELDVVLVDEAGNDFYAANARYRAPIAIEVRGAFDAATLASPPTQLNALTFPAAAGTVELVPEVGPPLTVEVVEARDITRVALEFQMAGTASGPRSLESGTTYGDDEGWGRAGNRIAPIVSASFVGSEPLCTAPAAEWFTLESRTPEICEVLPFTEEDERSFTFYDDHVGIAARLVADGQCSLVARMAEADGGAGIEATLAATFLEVELLHDRPEE